MTARTLLEFHRHTRAHIIRDARAFTRALLHTHRTAAIHAASAFDAAKHYLHTHCDVLGLTAPELQNMDRRYEKEPIERAAEYRFRSEKQQSDLSTVSFHQTCWGLPVWRAGFSIYLKHEHIARTRWRRFLRRLQRCVTFGALGKPRYCVIGSQTTGHFDLPGADRMPSPQALAQLQALDPATLARQLGIAGTPSPFDVKSLSIQHQRFMVYRYDSAKRAPTLQRTNGDNTGYAASLAMPLPPVAAGIEDGQYYAVAAVYFDLAPTSRAPFHWVALVEADTLSVLHLEMFSACVNGNVFQADPITSQGAGAPSATAPNDQLNPLRVSKPLQGLNSPNPQQSLIGANVRIADFGNPHIPAPTKPPNADFSDFDVRSDSFSAVNAYYHCDRFFRLVEELGFSRDDYFPGTTFPIPVDHRGSTSHQPFSGGIELGAQCDGTTTNHGNAVIGGIRDTLFCLAETSTVPHVGAATDWRVVLHELGGHGVLFNHVNASSFGFAHSAGDSLAAILSDPESNAPDKGATFPWSNISRRHDRRVEDGWGWGGANDVNDDAAQLKREQILSTTHFRIYKSIGGGSDDPERRWFAAKFTTYLILSAIKTLTPATNPQHAADWLVSLLAADSADWTSKGHSGGAYAKVIRWAFEKQGLFDGQRPDVDIYIDDGRAGEYTFQPNHQNCPAIWNRRAADGQETHEAPSPGVTNFAYVKIKNRGSRAAESVVVRALQSKPQSDLVYPDGWQPMNTAQLSVNDVPAHSAETTVGPFQWTPAAGDNYILMEVYAEGDPGNLHTFGPGRSIPDWRLVPNDNNLGLRKV